MYSKLRMIMGSGSIVGYFLQALPIACLAGMIYLAVRLCRAKKSGVQINWPTELLRLVFVCYLTGLVSLIILPANFWLYVYDGLFFGWWDELGPVFQLGDVDLVPSVIGWLSGELSLGSWVKKMLIGNIAMFIPMGFLLPLVTKIKDRKSLLRASFMIPLACEVLQLIFGRSFDIDDLICNFVGIMLGAAIAHCVLRGKASDV